MLDVRLGSPQQYQHLTIYPLLSATQRELPYLLLLEAINTSLVEITEKGSGSVPTLVARNNAEHAVLILDGEQLIGARQNRITNRSILLPPRSETEIPVYCMEQGRWRHTSHNMSPKEYLSPSKVRRHARKVEAQQTELGGIASEEHLPMAQSMVWNEIADISRKLETYSVTGALDHAYDREMPRIEEWTRHFDSQPEQVGLLAFVAERPLGMDVIGGRELYKRLHHRLLYGYVVDAMTSLRGINKTPANGAADDYLEHVCRACRTGAPSVGAGAYAVLTGQVIGGELVDAEQIVHLSAFPRDDQAWAELFSRTPAPETPLAPPSRRRRR